jgi:crotonobetaine/carnitine-CoA ligase
MTPAMDITSRETTGGKREHMNRTGTPRVLGELLAERLERNADRIFMQYMEDCITYGELDLISNRCANGFLELGMAKGDKVSIMLPNCPEFIYLWFGLAKIGAVEVPVNTNYKGEFLRHIIDQSDSRILVIDSRYLDRLELIGDELSKLEKLIVCGDIDKPGTTENKFEMIPYAGFIGSPEKAVDVKVEPSDPVSIIYTSGTTGLSKGALGPHNFWIVCAEKMLEYRNGGRDDIFYTFMPLYHFNAQVLTTLTTLVAEARMVLSDHFSASRFWDEIRHYGATQFNYLGAVMPILAKQPVREDDLDNPAVIALGAGCPPGVMEEVETRFGITCLEGFGMTEIGIPIHVRAEDRRKGSCGKPMDIYEVRLVDDDDNEVAPGETGEIVFRPREPFIMMLEYYNMPEKTVEASRNLWFHTGDLARKDTDGYFYFVDRKKDALRRRGENISSFEVERAINTHPKILESAAVAVKSELAEDEVKICVVLQPGESLEYAELIRYADERMPYFAVPRFVEFMESLPKTPTERIQKYILKQAGVTDTTWDREKAGIRVSR